MSKQPSAYEISPWVSSTIGHLSKSLDMTAPALVFGGLLAAAIAFCGGLDAAPTANRIGLEPRAANDENVIGYSPNDPVTSCGRERGSVGQRCRGKSSEIQAVTVH